MLGEGKKRGGEREAARRSSGRDGVGADPHLRPRRGGGWEGEGGGSLCRSGFFSEGGKEEDGSLEAIL